MALQFLDAERTFHSNTSDLQSCDRAAYAALAQSLFATKEFIFYDERSTEPSLWAISRRAIDSA